MTDRVSEGLSRRQVLGGAAAGAGIAAVTWSAPVILSVDAAQAATLPPGFVASELTGSDMVFMAVADNGSGDTAVRYTTDGGFNWLTAADQAIGTPVYLAGGTVALLQGTTSGPTGFVRTGDGGATWGPLFDPPSFDPINKAAQDPGVVAFDDSYEFAAAGADGYGSSTGPGFFDGPTLLSGADGDYVVAGVQAGTLAIAYSTDNGDNWQGALSVPVLLAAPTLLAAAAGGGVVYAAGNWLRTADGDTWAAPAVPPDPGFTPTFLVGGPAKFLAVDASGATYYSSTGGVSWDASVALGFAPSLVAGYGVSAFFVATSVTGDWAFTIDPGVGWTAPTTPPAP